jgi:hypothetical protein
MRAHENTLSIGFETGTLIGNLFRKAEITMPKLNELKLSGATNATVERFRSSEPFNLELSGASSLDLIDLHAENVEISVSGASSLSGIGAGNCIRRLFQVQVN